MRLSKRKLLSLLTGVSVVSISANVTAGVLEEIIVTAQKREQSLRDVPISVDVLSSENLMRAQINSTRALVSLTPSMSFTEGFSSVATTYTIRGIGSYVFEGGIQPAVSMVVDGVPLARNGEFVMDLADIERIEVLNGPQGTLFGRNSTGGAINIVRKRPTEEFESYVMLDYSKGEQDDDGMLTRFSVSGPMSDAVRGLLSGYYRNESGYIENLFPGVEDSGKLENSGVMGKLEFVLSDSVNLLVTGEFRNADENAGASTIVVPLQPTQFPQFPDITERHIAIADGGVGGFTINQDDLTKTESESWGISADLSWDVNDRLVFKSISSYRDVESISQPDVDGTPASPANPMDWPFVSIPVTVQSGGEIPRRPVNWDYFSQEFRLEYTHSNFDLLGGIFYQTFEETLENQVPLLIHADAIGQGALIGTLLDPSYPYFFNDTVINNSHEVETIAAFADITYHLTERLDVFAGLRVTHEELDFSYDRESWFIPVLDGILYDRATTSPLVPGVCTGDPLTNTCDPTAPTINFAGGVEEDEWSGRFGMSFKATDDINLYASVSRGFIGPGVDLSRATEGTPANPTSAVIAPSIATNYEVGFKTLLLDRRLQLNGAIFQLDVEDLQSSALIPGTVNTRVQNAGNIKTVGLELNAVAALTDNLTLSGGLSALDSEFEDLEQPCYPGQTAAQGCNAGVQSIDGKQGLNTPDLKYNVAVNYAMDFDSLPFDAYWRLGYVWQDDVVFQLNHDPFSVQDSYGLLDMTLGLVDKQGRYEVSLYGKNLTDEEFYNNLQESRVIARTFGYSSRASERYYGVSVRVNF